MNKKYVLGIFVFGLILFTLVSKTQSMNALLSSDNQKNDQLNLALTPHEPIEIFNDGNFTDYGFLGLGTAEEPYIIENYNITPSSLHGIYINGTTEHFVIRNCYVAGHTFGIHISDVAEGTASIINNIANNNEYGIELFRSSDAILTNNTCSNNEGYGVFLVDSANSILDSNICNNNEYIGIFLVDSLNSTLDSNTCNNNNEGIFLSSDGATSTNNTCSNNLWYGIRLSFAMTIGSSDSNNNIIHHNFFIDNNAIGTSQAYDSGTNNTWYEEETQEGNHWNDWSKNKPYLIDGDANSADPCPLNEKMERIDYEYTLVIPALILVAILLKRKKNISFR